MALIGKGRTMIQEERPSARREEVPNPHKPNPSTPSPAQTDDQRSLIRELSDVLETAGEMLQEQAQKIAEVVEPAPTTRSTETPSEAERAQNAHDVAPLTEEQRPNPATPVTTDAPPPKPPAEPNKPQAGRSMFRRMFLG